MLSKEDNELITNTDPGTPMGDYFRRFWMPVALSEELPGPDCIPIKLKIMNEELIAFRDSDGDCGLIDAYCPHRGAPMFFGRNEEAGIRCVYHGWKFDVTGQCVDLPNTPEGDTFKNKIKTIAYPCQEAGGMVFSYMGPRDKQPPFPGFDYQYLPPENIYTSKFQLECNWLQATEGDFDPSHGNFLHSTLDNNRSNPGQANRNIPSPLTGVPNRNMLDKEVPAEEPFPFAVGTRRITSTHQSAPANVRQTDVDGVMFTVTNQYRSDGRQVANMSLNFIPPVYCLFGGVTRPNHFGHNIRVPIDNYHMMFFRIRWALQPMTPTDLTWYKQGGYAYPEMIPGTWKSKANVWNDYEVDRLGQKTHLYSGIKTFPLQDIAMMENQWGPIAKREKEHLVSMDYSMIYLRRKLLRAAKDLAQGIEPKEPWMPEIWHYHPTSVVVENGDVDAAVAEATQRIKTSLLPEAQKVAPKILV